MGPPLHEIEAGAGTALADVVNEAVKRGANNFCWAAGIPGTLGGALLGNAGAWGHSIGEFVESVTVMNRKGEERTLVASSLAPVLGGEGKGEGCECRKAPASQVTFDYRRAVFPEPSLIVLSAVLRLAVIDAPMADPKALIRDYVGRKRRTQPLEHPSAGSVFKNPAPEKPAGVLIDKAGLKGLRVEGACVSPRHANFIVNDRHASALDVTRLIEQVRARVKETSGVTLELEIQVW